jgi:hypothetical protein
MILSPMPMSRSTLCRPVDAAGESAAPSTASSSHLSDTPRGDLLNSSSLSYVATDSLVQPPKFRRSDMLNTSIFLLFCSSHRMSSISDEGKQTSPRNVHASSQ